MKTLLFILLLFVSVTAILSGVMICISPDGSLIQLNKILLQGTVFNNFLIPGLVLTLIVGGSSLFAVYAIITKKSNRYNFAILAGVLLLGFLGVEWLTIKATSWLQFIYLCCGLLMILIGYQLKHKWAV